MTKSEARLKIAVHAGKNDNFSEGYRYTLRYGFENLPELQQKFDEIFVCLKELKETFYSPEIERELLADLNEILYESILYISNKKSAYCIVEIFAEVLSETLVYLLENAEYPFEAFDNYKENYDFLVDFNFNGDAGEVEILSINGINLPQDYIEFMKKYNGGEGSIGKRAWLILFPLEELEEINEDYCINEFLPNHCIIGSSGGGELFGVDTSGNYFAVPAVSISDEDKIVLGNIFFEFIQRLDTYLD